MAPRSMTSHPSLDSTPPPEPFRQWEDDILNERENVDVVLDTAYRAGFNAGADQELEACVEWMGDSPVIWRGDPEEHPGFYLREARRPKPPSLKEQALKALNSFEGFTGSLEEVCIIRRALESILEEQ